ncbi:MAG: hypothetical protein FWD58_02280 [Firmicutes bacterium]|nr:hypothetical protein [Bacillota bacterium]
MNNPKTWTSKATKGLLAVLMAAVMALAVFALSPAYRKALAEGDGSESNPFIIATLEDLAQLKDEVNGGDDKAGVYYRLDLSESESDALDVRGPDGYDNWSEPIGNESNPFCGFFDGGGYTVTGFEYESGNNIYAPDDYLYEYEFIPYKGLFGYVGEGGEIDNLIVEYLIQKENDLTSLSQEVCKEHLYNGEEFFDDKAGFYYRLEPEYDGEYIECNPYTSWTPIGLSEDKPFRGNFDGGGYSIRNMKIEQKDWEYEDYTGLFGYIDGGSVKNLGLDSVYINLYDQFDYVGGIVGYANNAIISGCFIAGDQRSSIYTGGSFVGGIVGYNNGSSITDCYVSGEVSIQADGNYGGGKYVGGIAGYNYHGNISGCFVGDPGNPDDYRYIDTEVAGSENVGGIAGYAEGGLIERCYTMGKVNGSGQFVGGITGFLSDASVADCYSFCDVTGGDDAGGIAGSVGGENGASVKNCYAAGSVTGSNNGGGIAGSVNGESSVANNASLHQWINASENAGRVVGFVGGDGILEYNYAFEEMSAWGSGFTGGPDLDGADITAEEINTAEFWTDAANWDNPWDGAVWEITDFDRLPALLGEIFVMPYHLLAIPVTWEIGFWVVDSGYSAYGSLTAQVSDEAINNGNQVRQYSDLEFRATLSEGYRIKQWRLDNGYVWLPDAGNVKDYYLDTFVLDGSYFTKDTTVTVEFEPIPEQFNVTVINGTASSERANSSRVGAVSFLKADGNADISLLSDEAWQGVQFADWDVLTGNVQVADNKFVMAGEDVVIAAAFEEAFVPASLDVYLDGEYWRDSGKTFIIKNNTVSFTLAPSETQPYRYQYHVPEINAGTYGSAAASYKVYEVEGGVERDTGLTISIIVKTPGGTATIGFHTVTYGSTFAAGGTVTAAYAVGGTNIPSGTIVQMNRSIVFTAAPASGRSVVEWRREKKDNRNDPDDFIVNATNTYTYVMTEAVTSPTNMRPLAIKAHFTPVNKYAVTFGVLGGVGSLHQVHYWSKETNYWASVLTQGTLLDEGTQVRFYADRPTGSNYRVEAWYVNGTSIGKVGGDNNFAIILTLGSQALDVKVQFELTTYAVTFGVSGGTGGSVSAASGGNIASGALVNRAASVTFTATPNAGYQIKQWLYKDIYGEWAEVWFPEGANKNAFTISSLLRAMEVEVEFEPITYRLTFAVGAGNGAITAIAGETALTSGQQVPEDTLVEFTAAPAPGYEVSCWIVGGSAISGLTERTLRLTPNADLTVSVEFAPIMHTVSFSVKGGNGTVGGGYGTGMVPVISGAKLAYGTVVVFGANPDANYRVKSWYVNDAPVEGNTSRSLTLMVAGETSVEVEFEPIPDDEYTVLFGVNETGGGGITAKAGSTDFFSGQTVVSGTQIIFTAQPNTGYQVKAWSVNSVVVSGNKSNGLAHSVTAETTVSVEFEPIPYAVTFLVEGGNGTMSASVNGSPITGGNQLPFGTEITFTATPNANYRVQAWLLNGATVVGNKTNTFTYTVAGADEVKLGFELKAYPVTYSVKGEHGSLVAMVNASVISSGGEVRHGSAVTFIAYPDPGYAVARWLLNGATAVITTNTTYVRDNIMAAMEVEVEFVQVRVMHVITFNVNGGNGQLTASYNGDPFFSGSSAGEGSVVAFTANPTLGYRVKAWTVDGVAVTGNTTNFYNHIATKAALVRVEFETAPACTVSFSVTGTGGVLTLSSGGNALSSGASLPYGSEVEFTAEQEEGFRVKAWTVGGAVVAGNTTNIYAHTLAGDLTVTVEFTSLPLGATFKVDYSVTGGNGQLTAKIGDTLITSGSEIAAGSDIVFTAAPAEGYRVKGWTVNGVSVERGVDAADFNEMVLSDFSEAAVVAVEFEAIPGAPPVSAQKPVISAGPQGAVVKIGGGAPVLSVTATSPDSGALTYQWYKNSVNNTTDGTAIEGETNATYTPDVSVKGTTYYYCVVTNTNGNATENKTATATSGATAIVVEDDGGCGCGTVADAGGTAGTVLLALSLALLAWLAIRTKNEKREMKNVG